MCWWSADCPVCYNVVQQHVNTLRRSIRNLRLIIENIGEHPGAIDDTDFRRQLTIVNATVVRLWEDARRLSGRPQIRTHPARRLASGNRHVLGGIRHPISETGRLSTAGRSRSIRRIVTCKL